MSNSSPTFLLTHSLPKPTSKWSPSTSSYSCVVRGVMEAFIAQEVGSCQNKYGNLIFSAWVEATLPWSALRRDAGQVWLTPVDLPRVHLPLEWWQMGPDLQVLLGAPVCSDLWALLVISETQINIFCAFFLVFTWVFFRVSAVGARRPQFTKTCGTSKIKTL